MRFFCALFAIASLLEIWVSAQRTAITLQDGQRFYLIPKTQQSCLPRTKKSPFRMGSDKVSLLRPIEHADGTRTFSKVLSFPGCFEMSAQIEVLDKTAVQSMIMYHSFKWLQALSNADVSGLDIGCTGADEYGCGGYGNKCYYCDVCKTLKKENSNLEVTEQVDFDCPTEVGQTYEYYESRCVNDWGSLDKDNDGTPDFMDDEKYRDYAQFLEDMKIEGFGTMRLTVYLATNATGESLAKMRSHKVSLQKKFPNLSHAAQESKWARIHKAYWLPKLVTENLISCVNIFFDICKHDLIADPSNLENFECPSSASRGRGGGKGKGRR